MDKHTPQEKPPCQEGDWLYLLLRASAPVYIVDVATLELLDANEAAAQQYGYSLEELLHLDLNDLRPPEDVANYTSALSKVPGDSFQTIGIWRQLKKDGSVLYAEISQRAIRYKGKDAVLAIARDVTGQMAASKSIRITEPDLKAAQAIAHVGSWIWDIRAGTVSWSDEAFRIYGYLPDSIIPNAYLVRIAIHPDDRVMVEQAVTNALAGRHTYDIDRRVVRPDGQVRCIHECADVQRDQAGQPECMIGTVQDVTEQRQAEAAINHIAYLDDVTGLPSRQKFRMDLQQALQTAQQHNKHLAVLIIQLNRLRDINFTLGPANGDNLLQQIGPRLREVLPPAAPLARFGDVQFATILMGASAFAASHAAEHIVDAMNRPFEIVGVTFAPGAHVGSSLFPVHGADTESLIRHANVAVFQAGHSGKDFVIYSAETDPYKPQRLAMLGEFRLAIENGQLLLYCQPQVDLQTSRVVAAEALVRWQHPKYGLIPPGQFIPLIEPTELIQPLTEWMLESAISQCYSWHQEGLDLPLSVNLSARNLQEQNLAKLIYELVHTWGAEPSWLNLEITEGSIMADPEIAKQVLDELKQYGFQLLVDDYGIGYSSLSYLMRLPVDQIKIDQSFVMAMPNDRQAAAIVRSSIELAHNLGLKIVAEGTASEEIWEMLKSLGCDEAQGHFISAPIPARDLQAWLENNVWKVIGKAPKKGN